MTHLCNMILVVVPSSHTANNDFEFPRPMLDLVICCECLAGQNSDHAYFAHCAQTQYAQWPAGSPRVTSLPGFTTYCDTVLLKAEAATAASQASTVLQLPDLTASFLHVTLLALDHLNVTAADASSIDRTAMQRVMCDCYCQLILDLEALTRYFRPGGFALHQARDMVSLAKSTQHPRHALLAEAIEEQIWVHQEWCNQLRPVLQRYVVVLICTKAEFANMSGSLSPREPTSFLLDGFA